MSDTNRSKFKIQRGILSAYWGNAEVVEIPEGVLEIGYRAFYQNETVKCVILPEGFKKIGIQAFAGCSQLERIQFPQSLRIVGHEALRDTAWLNAQPNGIVYAGVLALMIKGDSKAMTSAEIKPDTVKLNADLFRNCTALMQVTLPDALEEIDDRVFQNCRKLREIQIPKGVTRIGDRAFDECVKLSVQLDSIDTSIGRQCFMNDASVHITHLHPAKLPVNVRDSAVKHFADDMSEDALPDEVFVQQMLNYIQNRVTQYYPLALEHWNLLHLMIQHDMIPEEDIDWILDAVLSEGEADRAAALMRYKQRMAEEKEDDLFADSWDDLTLDWDIPTQEKTIEQIEKEWGIKKNTDGTYTLLRYYGTDRDVMIPSRIGDKVITAIGPYALSPDRYGIKHESAEKLEQIYKVTIQSGITRIANHAFAGCKALHEVIIPESVEQIGKDAFSGCNNKKCILQ